MALANICAPFMCIRLWLCLCFLVQFSKIVSVSPPTDTIVEGQTLGLSQTIVSSGQIFELGFFSPPNSSSFYLGIWYKEIEPRAVVWVGNRVQPLTSSSPYLTLEQGSLVIVDDRITYRVSSAASASNTSLALLDSGNLVLRDGTGLNIIWQSFDDPTDTFLPGMKLGIDKRSGKVWSITAWKTKNDPAPGTLSLKFNLQNLDEFMILKGNQTYWSSGSWNGMLFRDLPGMRQNNLYNFSFISDENVSYLTYSMYDPSILSMTFLDGTSGQLRRQIWLESSKQWGMFWFIPRDSCDVYSFCGQFSSCRNYSRPYCQCLEGFSPSDSESWEQGDTSGGCERKVPLQCEESSSVEDEKDGFLMIPGVVLPLNPKITYNISESSCRSICLQDCSCNAYAYSSIQRCLSWTGDLLNLGQLPNGDADGRQLYLKLAAYELQKNQGIET